MFNEELAEVRTFLSEAFEGVEHPQARRLVLDSVEWIKYSMESSVRGMENPLGRILTVVGELNEAIEDVALGEAPKAKLAEYKAARSAFEKLRAIVSKY
jgi:hypothetical protein